MRLAHLDVLRGLGIILVVGIHAIGYAGLPGGSGDSTIRAIWSAISTIAVASFFFCDGYLFALSLERSSHRSMAAILTRSARRLLWPWLVFTVLYTLARGGAELAGMFHDHLVAGKRPAEIALECWN